VTIERHTIISRDQWLALRKQDVTASRIGALFSCHPYVSALRVYLEHSGIEFPQEDNAAMRRGRLLESAVGLAVAEEHPEWRITKATEYLRDPDVRLGATPDFFIHDDPRGLGVLQTKTASPHMFEREWAGGKEVPDWIVLQTLVECMLSDAAFGVVGVLEVNAWNLNCGIVEIPRHPAAEDKIIRAVKQFWGDVMYGHEPPPDYGKDAGLLKILAPREAKDKVIDLSGNNALPVLLDERARLKERIKKMESRCEEIETELKFSMRDAAMATGVNGFKITWKTAHYDEYIVKARDTRILKIHDLRKDDT